jgi:Arc-like DNA binding domain
MNQIILEKVKSEVLDKLKQLAQRHDRSLEAEITAILENATENMRISTPPNRGWSEGFFEEVIGGWEGEPLVREPQPEEQERNYEEIFT